MNKLDEVIKRSVIKKDADTLSKESMADKLRRNADIAMGIEPTPIPKKVNVTKNLTFTFGVEEVDSINTQIERFLEQGKAINKSELIRIGLKLVEKTDDKELINLIKLINKHPRGRP